MKDGAEDDIDRVLLSDLHQGLEEPALHFFSLIRRFHGLIVFEIVADHEIRPLRTVAHASEFLSGAHAPDLDAAAGDDGIGPPDRALAADSRKILGQALIDFEFGFKKLDEVLGLGSRIADDQNKMAESEGHAPEGQNKVYPCGLRIASGSGIGLLVANSGFIRFNDHGWIPLTDIAVKFG